MAKLILHVDDDPQIPEGVIALLQADGYEWAQTADPERVMQLVAQRELALVLMEIDLQGCDGLDLLSGILSARADTPVLILTRAPRDSGMHGEAIALGVPHFLTKPVLRGELLSNIREVAFPAAAPAAAPDASAEPAPDLSGEIGDSPVPELLARLRRRGAAGLLRLRRGDAALSLQLRNGTPICASASRGGAVAPLADEDAAEARLFESFAWPDGSWAFFAGAKLPADTSCELSQDPEGLLVCGVLQACSPALARDRLRKRSTLYVSVSHDCDEFLAGIELTERQADVLTDLDGQTSLGDLLDAMAFEERMLYALWVGGRIELHAVPTLDLTETWEASPAPAPPEPELEQPETEPGPEIEEPELEELELDPEPEPELELDPDPEPELELDPDPEPELEVDPEPERERVREVVRVRPRTRPRPEPRARRVREKPAPAARPAMPETTSADVAETVRELARQMANADDFAVLGVPIDTSDAQVQEAYRRRLAEIPSQALEGSDLALRVRAERLRDRVESAFAHLKDPESRRAYALLRNEEGQDRKAGSEAERALEGERWFRKGRGHLEQRRYDAAAEAFGMASHLDPKEGEYLSHLGYALFLSRPADKVVQREAMEHVANGIKRSPTREMSYVYLGRILKARDENEAALKLFRRALRIKPDSHPALQEIRLMEMRQRKEAKGKGLLSRILGD